MCSECHPSTSSDASLVMPCHASLHSSRCLSISAPSRVEEELEMSISWSFCVEQGKTGEKHEGTCKVRQAIIQATLCAVSKVFCSDLIPQTSATNTYSNGSNQISLSQWKTVQDCTTRIHHIARQHQSKWSELQFGSKQFAILRRSYELPSARFQSCSRPPQMLLVASHPSKRLLRSWPNCRTHRTHKAQHMYSMRFPFHMQHLFNPLRSIECLPYLLWFSLVFTIVFSASCLHL